jgi:hypothetical protein
MGSEDVLVSWQDLEQEAPPIARLAVERFEATRVALLGTTRRDGSARISPVEPYLSQGELLFGAMLRSLKTLDLRRDPRCVIHTAITAPNAGEAEVKLYGRALEAPAEIRAGCSAGWWQTRPDDAVVFAVAIEQASSIEWSLEAGEMLVRRWSAGGLTETRRAYP